MWSTHMVYNENIYAVCSKPYALSTKFIRIEGTYEAELSNKTYSLLKKNNNNNNNNGQTTLDK